MKTFLKITLLISILALCNNMYSQSQNELKITMEESAWEYKPESAEFKSFDSRPAIKLLKSYDPVVLKDFSFTDGTIEYDVQPLDPHFAFIYFRWQNQKETECFYLRTSRAGNSGAADAVQYAPILDGTNLWDMLNHYQTNASFEKDRWNHIKLVISGRQMKVFVNQNEHPTLEVPILAGNTSSGTLAFQGKAIISDLTVTPNAIDNLSPIAGTDLTSNDARYIRNWQVSTPVALDKNIDFKYELIPDENTKWEPITTEMLGLINLTRKFGKTEGKRIVWLKTNINASKNQSKLLRLGFSDEVWVIVNDKPVYLDKNLYNTPMAKSPDGRCSLDNTSINLPLKQGNNEILIGVANHFFGWGIIARFDDIRDIKLN